MVHFGASRESVSLHTGVWYTKNQHESFCTLSTNLNHDPPGIMAHLRPVLNKVLEQNKKITILHFQSDGPTNQYRSKKMFALLIRHVQKSYPNISTIVYNFSESGHGKGPVDGVGAITKRTADAIVANGKDVDSFEKLAKVLKEKDMSVWYDIIKNTEFNYFEEQVPKKLVSFKGTMKVHQ